MGKYVVIGILNHSYYSLDQRTQDPKRRSLNNSAIFGPDVGVWVFDEPGKADQMAWEIAELVNKPGSPDLMKSFREFVSGFATDKTFHPLPDREIVDGAVLGLVETVYGLTGGAVSIHPVDRVEFGRFKTDFIIEHDDWLVDRKLDKDFPIFACFETMSLG